MAKVKGKKAAAGMTSKKDKRPQNKTGQKGKGFKKGKKTKTSEKAATVQGEEADLRSEVFALGGDEEDLELINEEGGGGGGGAGEADFSTQARKELQDFIKNLGLDKKFKEDSSGLKDEDEDDEDDFEVVESSDEDEDEAEAGSVAESSDEDEKESLQVDEVSSTTPTPTPPEEKEDEEETEVGDSSSKAKANKKEEGTFARPDFHFLKEKPSRQHCVVKTDQEKRWHQILPEDDTHEESSPAPAYWLPKLEKHAAAALELECENHRRAAKKGVGVGGNISSRSEMGFIDTVLKSGTLGDKISAMQVLLQESPVHNLSALDSLIAMVSLKSRRPCMMAMDALKETFSGGGLLPEDRKLRRFRENPFSRLGPLSSGNKDTRDRYLILWLFEHRLKDAYKRFLAAVDEVAKDTIDKTRTKAMTVFLDLLMSNPECEAELLERLVNKLGDPSRGVAAKAMYQLGVLLGEHPAMKEVVLKEVERVLYRANVSRKAQYYGVCFLSQVLLEEDEADLANRLIGIYFGFFRANVNRGEIDSKLMSALLTGVNRAYPYATVARDKLEDQLQLMFKLVHMLAGFNSSVQALALLYQITDGGQSTASDRFYSALYKKVSDPGLASSSSKVTVFLNLLFKSMKKDPSPNRVKAFVKRLLQVCSGLPSEIVCGVLFLVSEVIRSREDLSVSSMLEEKGGRGRGAEASGDVLAKFDDDDEDEHYADVKEEAQDEDDGDEEEGKEEVRSSGPPPSGSWVHRRNVKAGGVRRAKAADYDPHHRNPAFCGAENSALWELRLLSAHAHPSVSLFARTILDGGAVKYSGDPLQDFTLTRFLDRFVFRNPKKDPLRGKPTTVLSRRSQYVPGGVKGIAPDSKEYANIEESAIPTDERFIHRYFAEKKAKKAEDEVEEGDEPDSDAESVTDEQFDDFMEDYYKQGGKAEDPDDEELDDEDDEEGEEDLDFASGVGEVKEEGSDEEDEDENESEPELDEEDQSDSDVEFEDIKDIGSDDEFDEEGFDIEDDDEEGGPPAKKKSRSLEDDEEDDFDFSPSSQKKSKFSTKGKTMHELLASAEEYADLVEEAAADDLDLGGFDAVSNVKDKAGRKQLKWESGRHGGGGEGGKGFRGKKGKGGGGKKFGGGKKRKRR